ncbi:MAG TPA: CCA tRNA nucleotidyltransferase [Gemmatimonadales bacterium]|nr:CCA tRNA nucleotidyltransferase [Gemmatimonadales bacterium]
MSFPRSVPVPEEILEIARVLERAGHEAWCVGGALRDTLLGDPHSDFDLATSARPQDVQGLFRRTAPIGVEHGTVGVIDRKHVMHEVTTFRRDVRTDGRHAVVEYGASLDEDLARRDFTINAIAYQPLRHEWRDPHGGMRDLQAGLIRAVGDPAARFREDYLRILRAIRFAARFEFAIDPPTWQAAREAAGGLGRLSAERVRDEWFKALRTARDLRLLVRLWHDSGGAAVWLPELRAADPTVPPPELSPPPRDPVLITAVLAGDPVGLLRRLRSSNAEIARAQAMVAGPTEPEGAGEIAVRRWLAAVGGAADDLVALYRLRRGSDAPWLGHMQAIRERHDPLTRGDLAVSGRDLEALGIRGRAVGETLSALLARVLEDPVANTRERLLELARERR